MSRNDWPKKLECLREVLLQVAQQQLRQELWPRIAPSDLVQQTLIEALQAPQACQQLSGEDLSHWLRHLLRNNARDAVRRAQAGKRDVARELRFRTSTRLNGIRCHRKQPDSVVAHGEVDVALDAAIAELPLAYQRVVLLRHRERLSFGQIAEQLNVTENAAQKLWTRALETLRARLGKFA